MADIVKIEEVKDVIIPLRGKKVILDVDVAKLYGVTTREVNQAIRNNPDKFPEGYVLTPDRKEYINLRSKFLTTKISPKSRYIPKAFMKRGYICWQPFKTCMHRDFQSNMPIRLYHFDDYIEVMNPGGLYVEARPENFPTVNDYRNSLGCGSHEGHEIRE